MEISMLDDQARIAQLEDELTVCQTDALSAASATKPPISIDTGTHINSPGGLSALPNEATGKGLGLLAGVLAVVGLLVVFVKRK